MLPAVSPRLHTSSRRHQTPDFGVSSGTVVQTSSVVKTSSFTACAGAGAQAPPQPAPGGHLAAARCAASGACPTRLAMAAGCGYWATTERGHDQHVLGPGEVQHQVLRVCSARPAVLGVKLVVVLGAKEGIDRTVRAAGREVRYVHGQRVTDEATMQAAVQAAGAVRMQFEARLSRVRAALRTSCSVPVHCCHHHRTADAAWCNVDAL
jgi:hypothetical protein